MRLFSLSGLTAGEKIELALIPMVSLAFSLLAPVLPRQIALGSLLLFGFAMLLTQSLLRDLWLLASIPHEATQEPGTAAQCMCVESAVGATGVLAGIVVLGAGIGHPVVMQGWEWALCILVVGFLGYSIKDFVFEWNPWSVRREKNHRNIIVRWKK
ncbi:MAG TPA: hypothetical protein VK660_08030 [Xanthomonadaceae bacterium]|jgi:hypothetical protein|nr:hypothetical protein [Xanthomonadaceae bacterium]